MESQVVEQATEIAARPYSIDISEDETTSGHPIYVAQISELEGCIAQGNTVQEALRSLREAAIDYIVSLLEDGLPVPPPSRPVTASTSTTSATFSPSTEPRQVPAEPIDPARLYEFHFTIR
jgi:predicted RNase H-like HicB family nuclease